MAKPLLVIFGASGHLSKTKLLPAILKNKNYKDANIVLYSRNIPQGEIFQKINELGCDSLQFIQGEYTDKEKLLSIFSKSDSLNVYFAIPSNKHFEILKFINSLDKKISVYIDKPHFSSYEEVEKAEKFENITLKLIDHYLLKRAVLLWSFLSPEKKQRFLSLDSDTKIKCVVLEKSTIENRYAFNNDGIVNDMIISHLFAIADVLFDGNGIKKLIFKRTRAMGQYLDYEFHESETATFAQLLFKTKEGVEVEFIAGKAFSEKETYIEIDDCTRFEVFPDTKIIINGVEQDISTELKEMEEKYGNLEGYELLIDFLIHKREFPTVSVETVSLGYKFNDEIEKYGCEMFIYKRGISLPQLLNELSYVL